MNAHRMSYTRILGVPITLTTMEQAVAQITLWAKIGLENYVCVRDVPSLMLSQDNVDLKEVHEKAGMITPDGMPLVWVCKSRGYKNVTRVSGADLVTSLCESSQATSLRHYFYGGKAGVAQKMASTLLHRYPNLIIAGFSTPPIRDLDTKPFFDFEAVQTIAATSPSVVWVGLSSPKQEYWMRDHVGRIPGAVLIGVGAAFDFHSGTVKRAPIWMQNSGLEWLHRLLSDPIRLWRRYLIFAPLFVIKLTLAHYKSKYQQKNDKDILF